MQKMEDKIEQPVAQFEEVKLRTAVEARDWLSFQGLSITEFSRMHGFSGPLVMEILKGRKKCSRGQSHNIAIALGMKTGEPTNKPGRTDKPGGQLKKAIGSYDPKLSEAGFMDLVVALTNRFKKADMLAWREKALTAQGNAALQLEIAAKSYIAAIEG